MNIPKIVIIGRPNVGKSSLFNRIIGKRHAIVHDVAGTTRDFINSTVNLDGKSFELYDTAGHLSEKGNELTEKSLGKIKEAIELADLLLFVVDGTVMPTAEDTKLADIARKTGKPVILAINKIDNPKMNENIGGYDRFGFKDYFPISAIHNLGIAELLAAILKNINRHPELVSGSPEIPGQARNDNMVKVAILGRPNVGKSSILNSLCGHERAIVSSVPGTTRDVISEIVNNTDIKFKISDTAGARKPGKIGKALIKGEPVEKYSFLRTQKEIEQSDIVLVIIDASEKIAAQDLHIAGQAKEQGKGIILVINKWDLVKDLTQEEFLRRLRKRFDFMIWVPAIFVSAKTGRNIKEILNIIKTVHENQLREIPTAKLNRIIEDFVLVNPPKGLSTFRPKLFFASQKGAIPPTITISAKYHGFIHFSWRRALENELRRHFDFTGTPIRIIFKAK